MCLFSSVGRYSDKRKVNYGKLCDCVLIKLQKFHENVFIV
jgi:hypothetical protein